MIQFVCPSCGQRYRVRDGIAGKARSCNHCGARIVVPRPQPPVEITPEMLEPAPDPWREIARREEELVGVDRDEALPVKPKAPESTAGRTCAILSVVCSLLAAVLCPPFFGLAGLILGVVGIALCRDKFLAVAGVVLSILGTTVGLFLWFAAWLWLSTTVR